MWLWELYDIFWDTWSDDAGVTNLKRETYTQIVLNIWEDSRAFQEQLNIQTYKSF